MWMQHRKLKPFHHCTSLSCAVFPSATDAQVITYGRVQDHCAGALADVRRDIARTEALVLERLATGASVASAAASLERWSAALRSSRATDGQQATAAAGANGIGHHTAPAAPEPQALSAAAETVAKQGQRAIEAALASALGAETAASLLALLRSLHAREAELVCAAEYAAGPVGPPGPGQPAGGGGSTAAELAVSARPAYEPSSSASAAPLASPPSVRMPTAAPCAERAVSVGLVVEVATGRVRVHVRPACRGAGPHGLSHGPAHNPAVLQRPALRAPITTTVNSAAGLPAMDCGRSPGEAAMGGSADPAASAAPGLASTGAAEGEPGRSSRHSQATMGASEDTPGTDVTQGSGTASGGAEGCGVTAPGSDPACCRQGEPHAESGPGPESAGGRPSAGREALLERELQEARAAAAAAQAEAAALRAELQSAPGPALGSGAGPAQRWPGRMGPNPDSAGAGGAGAPSRQVAALRCRVRPLQGLSPGLAQGSAQHACVQRSMSSNALPC